MQSERPSFTNRLINETSPYLLQHAQNPVDWYPWGEEAFLKAREEKKLILISIGYAACHWCHVMERESFENDQVARFMNDQFVSVKVDREERPDVDQVYMTAVQLMTGSGGWPLNCFALPDGSPLYGGTYFPPDKWLDLLQSLSKLFKEEPEKVVDYARKLKEGIINADLITQKEDVVPFHREELVTIFAEWKRQFDTQEGGFKGAPKFPMPGTIQSQLLYYYHSKDKEVYNHILLTLDKMAMGGIYDHIGGGFARYSVDNLWKVPHFEKMLYDNGQLASIYCQAFQLTKKERYKKVVYETLSFIDREMTSDEGGFYSSFDADSEGVEGKYYVWDKKEIKMLLGKRAEQFSRLYNISTQGNWEQTNILHQTVDPESFASQHGIPPNDLLNSMEKDRQLLYKSRSNRIKPGLDDKIITSWNTIMQKGFIDAYRVFGEIRFLDIAKRNAMFIKKNLLTDDHRLKRNYKNGKSTINGFLDDYALLIEAWVGLYEVTFNEEWLSLSIQLMDYVIDHFYDASSGMFFYTSDLDPPLVARKMELSDNVIPASNSAIAHGLLCLGKHFEKIEFLKISEQMVMNMKSAVQQNPGFNSNWLRLMIKYIHIPYEVVITGPESELYRKQLDNYFLPDIILAGSNAESDLPLLRNRLSRGMTMIYVCRNNVCQLPVENVEEAIGIMQ